MGKWSDRLRAIRFDAAVMIYMPPFRSKIKNEKNRFITAQMGFYKRVGKLSPELLDDHADRLSIIFKEHYKKVFKAASIAAKYTIDGLKMHPATFEMKASSIHEDALFSYFSKYGGQKIKDVAKTTMKDINGLIVAAFESGEPESAVIKAGLKARGYSAFRADTIARTETSIAAAFASRYTATKIAQDAGIELEKKWMPTLDERTRPAHMAMANSDFQEIDQPFIVDGEALDYPSDPSGSPENVINCFLPDTKIHGMIDTAIRSNYSGPVIEIRTANGRCLRVTPNHPIATNRGMLRASDINCLDDLFCYKPNIKTNVNANDDDAPPVIQEVFNFISKFGSFCQNDRFVFNLHGEFDRTDGQIQIVSLNGELVDEINPSFFENGNQWGFSKSDISFSIKSSNCPFLLSFLGINGTPSSFMRCGSLPDNFFRVFFNHNPFNKFGVRASTNTDFVLSKDFIDGSTRNSILDPTLFAGNSRNVVLDKVIDCRLFQYSGHVYDLQSLNGWIIADGVFTSNCRCQEIRRVKLN